MDLIGIILWPLKWVVELVLVAWHALFTAIGLPPADGITWVLSIVGLVIVVSKVPQQLRMLVRRQLYCVRRWPVPILL